ncbi:MAG: hypothetical protein M1820_000176 [Bogoriella megaspora]|nr:MAG: hypothetical protein M1820_000176 [Bogoriella megaspora]
MMERMPGQCFEELKQNFPITQQEIDSVVQELIGFVKQLRTLQAPQAGTADGRPLRNLPFWRMMSKGHWTLNPNHEDAKKEWYQKSLVGVSKSDLPILDDLRDNHYPASEPYTFTHGDLHGSNIMVQDGHITGIVDWELSGFAPYWWESLLVQLVPRSAIGSFTKELGFLSTWSGIFDLECNRERDLHERLLGDEIDTLASNLEEDPIAPPPPPYPKRISNFLSENQYMDMDGNTHDWEKLPPMLELPEFDVDFCRVQ